MSETKGLPIIVWDFGGVLMDWDPRYLYRKVFQTEEEMEYFLKEVCTMEWNLQFDAGKPFAEGIRELSAVHPKYSDQIEIFYSRWIEMIHGDIPGSVEILFDLKSKGYQMFGLTNWSRETFPLVRNDYRFFGELDGILVSGEELLAKPNPEIFELLLDRYGLDPKNCIFIDDSKPNIEAAQGLEFGTIHFQSPDQLKKELHRKGIL